MGKPLRVLVVEDSEDDALLMIRALKAGGYDPVCERVERAEAMRTALREKTWDVILCDYQLPQFNGLAAIALLEETGIDIPLIVVSGAIGEETAADCMRCGAHDYVMKGSLSRLVPAVERELKEAESRRQRRCVEEALKKSQRLLVETGKIGKVGGWEFDMDTGKQTWTEEVYNIHEVDLPYDPTVGKGIHFYTPASRPIIERAVQRTIEHGEPFDLELEIITAKGNLRSVHAIGKADPEHRRVYGFFQDITDFKQAEESLQKSEQRYRLLVENTNDAIVVVQDGRAKYVNRGIEWAGYSREEYLSMPVMETVHPEDREAVEQRYLQKISGGTTPTRHTYRGLDKGGRIHWIDVSSVLIDWEGRPATLNVITDITDRKQTERRQFLTTEILGIINDAPLLADSITRILISIQREMGFEAVGIRLRSGHDFPYFVQNGFSHDFLLTENTLTACDQDGGLCRDENGNISLECTCGLVISGRTDPSNPLFTEGGSFWTNDALPLLDLPADQDPRLHPRNRCIHAGFRSVALIPIRTNQGIVGLLQLNDRGKDRFTLDTIHFFEGLGVSIGIALKRKQAEDELKEALEKYSSLAAYVDSMYLVDRDCTYLFMNERHLKRFGLSLEEVVGKKYSEFHSEEDTRRLVEDVNEVCETGIPSTKEHRSERDGRFFLRTFTPIIGHDSGGKISQVAVISKEITNIKLTEKKLHDTLDSLRKAVNTTIQVMVSAVEARDPYTAGHQARSADLARAIATEMGLPQEKIDGIRMAGSIHDIGKLSIPAEILSKPTKLSAVEFLLIKEHANRGYEILKDVESSWPLAEIVHQHHERMDGSGYPNHLKGDAILIEARILAVADVVESMASHRPYRAALGLNVAMEEIKNHRETLYDADVVNACLKIFREKGYQIH